MGNYYLEQLKNVKTITIDMNASYVGVIKDLFPQANILSIVFIYFS